MSLLPLIKEALEDSYFRPLYDQHFGLGILNDDIVRPMNSLSMCPMRCGYLRPWRNMTLSDSGMSSITSDKNEFRVNLDVQQFKPNELKATVADGYLVVEGKHEEKADSHGFISRQFTRRYKLPEDINEETIESSLSSDGVLTLRAAKKTPPEATGRNIPITQTKQPAVTTTEKNEEKPEK